MTRGFQRFTKRYVNVLGVLIGLTVVSSILLYAGCGMVSSPNTPTRPPVRPTSTITSPTAGATVSTGTTVSITGTASVTGGGTVARVDVSVDGGATFSAATGTTAWSYTWTPTTPGPATIRSRVVDNNVNQQDPPAEITVTVRDTTPPTSTITSPTAGATVLTSHLVNITGTASDAGGGTLQSVQVSVDGGATWNVATGTTAWSYNWTPTLSGSATIKSRAIDNSGNQQDPPAQVTVTIRDATPPTSTISFPADGSTVPEVPFAIINGTASDTGGGVMDKVEVSLDGGATWNLAVLGLGRDTWDFSWTPSPRGRVTIKSRAIDNSGNVQDPPTESTVTIVDGPPVVITRSPQQVSNVPLLANVTATFNEALDPAK